jgi:16S rRNA (guanine527-N7)-methyltransferase
MIRTLRQGIQQFDLDLTEAQLKTFEDYLRELVLWNERINLTGIREPSEIIVKHFLDSLSIAPVLKRLPAPLALIDVGSGAGFPGLPLKIILPDLQLTLLESVGKKTTFLRHLAVVLDLNGVTVLTARAEEAGRRPDQRERYDVAVARAVAPLPVLAEYTLPLVKVGGWVIAQKGLNPEAEVKEAANALGILGGKVRQILPTTVPGLEAARHLVIIQKKKPTPKQYPRRPGIPAKKPI